MLDAARETWEPYRRRIDELEEKLNSDLMPAARRAAVDLQASVRLHGGRAHERAAAAAAEVDSTRHEIAALEREGAAAKHRLDRLEGLARCARAAASSDYAESNRLQRDLLQIGQLIEAVDTYTGWLDGRPTSVAQLDHAAATLEPVARHTPSSVQRAGDISQAEWHRLLGVRPEHRGIGQHRSAPEISFQR